MSQERKFHADTDMIRKLYDKFGPSSQIFRYDYDNLQFQFMKFTVIERIVDALIQRIRNAYNFTVITDKEDFLPGFKEAHNLIDYYSKSTNAQVQKILDFLGNIAAARDKYYSEKNNLEFLVFIQNTFSNSCKSLKSALNDRMELGLYYHEKFTFFDKLFKSILLQLKKAENLSNEFEQVISINKVPDQNYEFDDIGIMDEEDDQEVLIEKFVTAFKANLT